MLKQKLIDEINEQIKLEFYSAHLYLAAASYANSLDLDGFANFFIVQAEEERFHAMKFYHFLVEMGQDPVIKGFDTPPADFDSLTACFKQMLGHEKKVTERIYLLMDLATDDREHATISFLKWFVDEQVEEEATFTGLVKKLERAEKNPAALYSMDSQLASRSFTEPTE